MTHLPDETARLGLEAPKQHGVLAEGAHPQGALHDFAAQGQRKINHREPGAAPVAPARELPARAARETPLTARPVRLSG